MRWLLDTNIVIDAFAGQADAVKAIGAARSSNAEWVGFSSITRLEVLGFSGLGAADDKGLRELLAQFNEVLVTPAVIDEAIRIRRAVRIKTPDARIAATAVIQGASILTRNVADFRRVAGLNVIDPAAHCP